MNKKYYIQCDDCGASYTKTIDKESMTKEEYLEEKRKLKICKKCSSYNVNADLGGPKFGYSNCFRD